MNKKAAIPSGIVWIVATAAIIIMGFIFIASVLFLGGKDIYLPSEKSELQFTSNQKDTLLLQKSVESLLSSQHPWNGEQLTLKQILAQSSIEKGPASDLFNTEAKKALAPLLPETSSGTLGQNPWWIRVYKKGERITPTDRLGEEYFHVGGFTCAPIDSENIILISYFVGDKRIILCVNRQYYETIQNEKTK